MSMPLEKYAEYKKRGAVKFVKIGDVVCQVGSQYDPITGDKKKDAIAPVNTDELEKQKLSLMDKLAIVNNIIEDIESAEEDPDMPEEEKQKVKAKAEAKFDK